MNQVLDGIDKVVTAISGVLYMPWVPFLLLAAFTAELILLYLFPVGAWLLFHL